MRSDNGLEDIATEQLIRARGAEPAARGPAGARRGRPPTLPWAQRSADSRPISRRKIRTSTRCAVTSKFASAITSCTPTKPPTTPLPGKSPPPVTWSSTAARHDEHLVGTAPPTTSAATPANSMTSPALLGVQVKNRTMFLTSSTPFFFTGDVVDKLGPDRYRVHHGYVTSCQLPKPKWQLDSRHRQRRTRQRSRAASCHLEAARHSRFLLSLPRAPGRQSRTEERIPDPGDRTIQPREASSSATVSTG